MGESGLKRNFVTRSIDHWTTWTTSGRSGKLLVSSQVNHQALSNICQTLCRWYQLVVKTNLGYLHIFAVYLKQLIDALVFFALVILLGLLAQLAWLPLLALLALSHPPCKSCVGNSQKKGHSSESDFWKKKFIMTPTLPLTMVWGKCELMESLDLYPVRWLLGGEYLLGSATFVISNIPRHHHQHLYLHKHKDICSITILSYQIAKSRCHLVSVIWPDTNGFCTNINLPYLLFWVGCSLICLNSSRITDIAFNPNVVKYEQNFMITYPSQGTRFSEAWVSHGLA